MSVDVSHVVFQGSLGFEHGAANLTDAANRATRLFVVDSGHGTIESLLARFAAFERLDA